MKWIGQHIFDLIARFRSLIYLESLESSSNTDVLVVDSDGKVTKNTAIGGDNLTITNAADNRVITSTGGAGLNAEANFTFDGSSASITSDLYLPSLTEQEEEYTVMVAADGQLTKSTHPGERSRLQVRNDEGSTIPAGAPLYSRGEIGGSERILVGIADSNDTSKMPCIGIAEFEMNTTSTKDSFAISQGVYNTNIHGFTGLSEGDILYVDDSGSAPYLTQNKSDIAGSGNAIQNVGIVLKTTGTICQGLLVSAIGRSNDVPNLDENAIFLGNSSDQAEITDAPMVGVITAANAAAARTVLGVDAAGTDNSTDVTLAGQNYLSLAGQQINANSINLTSNVTGNLPLTNGGTGASTVAGAKINLQLNNVPNVDCTNANNITSGTLPLTRGGTGATTAAGARTNLGIDITKRISTTHHCFTTVSGGSAAQDYWVPFIGTAEQAAPNNTHRTVAPYDGLIKRVVIHSKVAFGASAQARFHVINDGDSDDFDNANSTDDVTTNVTADASTAYSSVTFNFTTGNTFSEGDQLGLSFVRDNTAGGDVALTIVWEYTIV